MTQLLKQMVGSEKQLEFWREAHHRWNFKVGATRAGKTYMDYFLIPQRLMERRKSDGFAAIIGNTRETVRRNIITPMQNIYGTKRVGNIRTDDNTCMMFGQRVQVFGADNIAHADRIRGMSLKYCYGDEVATWNPEVFEMLKSRLDKPDSCFDGALNPQSPSHWLKSFLDSNADVYVQKYTIFDNPFLTKEFVDNLCREYAGTVYYQRYILGEWALAEGLIYPMYQEAIDEPVHAPRSRVLSLDYGTMNAFAAGLWELCGDVWYMTREYYYSGRDTGAQKTDEEYAQALDEWLKDIQSDYSPYNRLKTIIDPSAASFIALLRKRGWYNVIPADNAVADGIRETASCLQTGKIKICPWCKNWIKEAQGYVWDDSATDDKPVKVNDHIMDATRYFVKTMNIIKPRSTYVPIYAR